MIKRSPVVLGLIILSLAMGGCADQNNICNVSLGSTKGTIFQQNHNHCAYPGLVTLPDGNLLVAYSCNPGISADGNLYPHRIETQISTDNGANWHPGTPVIINATVVSMTMLRNGTVFLSTSTGAVPKPGIPAYFTGTIGTDDQITWSAPTYISVRGWTKGCWAVSPLVQLANGNLLWPVWCYSNSTGTLPGTSMVLISSDDGITWSKQVIVGNGTHGYDFDESAAVVFPNGEAITIIRHNEDAGAKGFWFWTKSTDNGNSWPAPFPLVSNHIVGRPALALFPSGALVLMGRARIHGSETPAFATSWNGGDSFSRFAPLGISATTNHDMYDAMSLRPDGTVGVVSIHGTFDEKTTDADYRVLVDSCPVETEGASNR